MKKLDQNECRFMTENSTWENINNPYDIGKFEAASYCKGVSDGTRSFDCKMHNTREIELCLTASTLGGRSAI